jgi:hypothetical protein
MTEDAVGQAKEFVPSKGLTTAEAERNLEIFGRNELAEKKKSKVIQIRYSFLPILN